MAHLWLKNESEQWAVLLLEADAFVLTTNPPQPMRNAHATDESVSKVVLLCDRRAGEASWVLISGRERDVRINGVPLALGVRVVADRDEIFVAGIGHLYFSTESLARVEEFPGAEQKLYCPRCKQEVERDNAAVKCPQCHVWYHQSEGLPCWSYSETCAVCPQLTALDAGYRWTPEGL
jgi:Zn finger protein HypA/HybF involved in hydrogenase expression